MTVQNPDSPIFFPVQLRQLDEITGLNSMGLQAVCRTDASGQASIIAVHGRHYRLVDNMSLLTAFETAIDNSNIDRTGMTVKDALAYEGGRMLRTYRFPAHTIDIAANDPVHLQLQVINSYDGSCRFSAMLGAFRQVCSNGLVIGETLLNMQQKHTQALDVDHIARELIVAADTFADQGRQWMRWNKAPIDEDQAEVVISNMNVSEKQQEVIMDIFRTQRPQHGYTVWSLFNALTWWSSHTEVKPSSESNASALQLTREARVRAVLDHPVFDIAA